MKEKKRTTTRRKYSEDKHEIQNKNKNPGEIKTQFEKASNNLLFLTMIWQERGRWRGVSTKDIASGKLD